jgi:hypothetical protein
MVEGFRTCRDDNVNNMEDESIPYRVVQFVCNFHALATLSVILSATV